MDFLARGKEKKDFFISGIGASTRGGWTLLTSFLKSMPSDNWMAFFLIRHHASTLHIIFPDLLKKYKKIESFCANNGMSISKMQFLSKEIMDGSEHGNGQVQIQII